jgi:hypothetical protein
MHRNVSRPNESLAPVESLVSTALTFVCLKHQSEAWIWFSESRILVRRIPSAA